MNNQLTCIVPLMVLLNVLIKVHTADNEAVITEYENDNLGNGEYSFRFVQSDDIEREESGKFEGEDNYVVKGHYSYIDPNGKLQRVEYYADNTGYHPKIVDQNEITITSQPPLLRPEVIAAALPPAAVASLLG